MLAERRALMLWWGPFGGTGLTFLQLIVLAIVQAVTAFLPVSSRPHLLLAPAVIGVAGAGSAVGVAIHVGALAAVVAYLWRDSWAMLTGLWRFARTRRGNPGIRLIGLLILGTLPIAVAAYVLHSSTYGTSLQGPQIVAWATLGFGVVLFAIDRTCLTVRRMEHLGAGSAIAIGLFQVLALLPGTSRAGIAMTAGRLLGYERPDAARFSLLLSIPALAGAAVLLGLDAQRAGELHLGLAVVLAALIAFVAALIAIAAMMSWLRNGSFTPFVVYRVLLGIFLLVWLYTGWFGSFMPPAPH
jgi:undecaprenyl-diphosphatase